MVSVPADGDVWSTLLGGPYGFVVVIAALGWLGLKEWRKGRAEDVAGHRARADAAEAAHRADVAAHRARADAAEAALRALEQRTDRDMAEMRGEILKLQRQIFGLQRQVASLGATPVEMEGS